MKKAFTLLELVFVIVVVGILVAVILPRTKTNPVQEASVSLLSYIRYTQHLALVDDKYDTSNNINWYKKRWQLQINTSKLSIVSDRNVTYAKDPSNPNNPLQNIDFLNKYTVTISPNSIISFDYLGRPLTNNNSLYSGLLTSDYNITISNGNENAVIKIHPETGYACILNIQGKCI